MDTEKIWYAVYTKPRWEKKVFSDLNKKGIECYCPLNKVRKKWSDRIKIVEEPLFKSYVFVKLEEAEKLEVRNVDGIVNFVYWLGKPAMVRDNEIDAIKRFLGEYENVQLESIEIKPNQKVIVTSGLFMDKKGIVQKVYKNKVEILIETLGYKLVANIDKNRILHS